MWHGKNAIIDREIPLPLNSIVRSVLRHIHCQLRSDGIGVLQSAEIGITPNCRTL